MTVRESCYMGSFAKQEKMRIRRAVPDELRAAIAAREPISGYTHNFYRYPARFSPLFVREVIRHYSRRGEVVLDPFMGGGTAIVEAIALGRKAIGVDLNLDGYLLDSGCHHILWWRFPAFAHRAILIVPFGLALPGTRSRAPEPASKRRPPRKAVAGPAEPSRPTLQRPATEPARGRPQHLGPT